MSSSIPSTATGPIEEFVNAYESVRARTEVPIAAFLPARDDPRFLPALAELIRVELEYAWAEGHPRPLLGYRAEFPELFQDSALLGAVAFEEYRLRRQAGEAVQREEYARAFGIDTTTWPDESGSIRELSQRLAEAEILFPNVGDTVAGFRLERELGRGAFGRVYLARQGDLADRPVALKVAADVGVESRTLARLQHTNVMPVYSVHRAPPFQAVCMPFFPAVTLADLCRSLKKRETAPESGQALLETLRSRTALAGQIVGSDFAAPEPAAPPVKANLDLLAGVSFVQAVVWIGARLADGLAHAHERGIVHRDLKPANILLTDEGQPLILDFNLAADLHPTAEQARAALGGTLPYMPPEHLQAFRDHRPFRDPRGDVYALGLILFEMLAGRHPFPIHRGDPERVLPAMIADRQQVPSVRSMNRAVPRGLDAVLMRCLHPDPLRRYPTARELQEDLQRQFDDRPLQYAHEPLREQAAKWRRRHPRLTSWVTVGAVALLLLVTAGLTVQRVMSRNEVLATREVAQQFHVDFEDVHFRSAFPTPAGSPGLDVPDPMERFHDRWPQVFSADLTNAPWTSALNGDELNRLRREVGDSYYLMADRRDRTPHEALAFYERAVAAYPVEDLPRALWIKRARAYRALGDWAAAEQAESEVARTPVKAGHDYLWTANLLLEESTDAPANLRDLRSQALGLLQEAVRADPSDPLIHSYLAYIHLMTRRPAAAAEHYGLSIGLYPLRVPRPGAEQQPPPFLYFYRGLAYYQARNYADAERDFGLVIDRQPSFADARVNRAMAREKRTDIPGALADVDHVLTQTPDWTEVRFQRSRLRRLVGDEAGANTDRAAALQSTPKTARGWHARSAHQADPRKALADIDEALKLERDSAEALQHKASLLAAVPGRQDEAIRTLDQLLSKWPEFVPGRAGRAVLLARAGRDDEALADSNLVLEQEREPLFVYQVAGAHALVSDRRPEQRAIALALLTEAFRREASLVHLARSDPELRPLQDDPKFQRLLAAAMALSPDREP